MTRTLAMLFTCCLLIAPPAGAVSLVVEALLPNTAVITIDGTRKTLRAGQSHGGVTLISADAKAAVVEVNGQRQTVRMHQRITGSYQAPTERVVSIPRDAHLQYRTTAHLNGRSMQVIVDTGANVVAMNSDHARRLGVDVAGGQPTRMETASGVARAWTVTLHSVDVGGIRVDNVQAVVAEGGFPRDILLGMTYLRHVSLSEEGGVLSLRRQW
ncbi:retropepsin-like aspartic protease family protein [Parahaliea mediterranea]|uniref:retropepsin-like aspartic protease family protein n=1 Tax=Parahaliea mediterranea TaxID=651086 RepID=UPI0019D4576C|nr:TIGR02281 family clan AA aspartic protease [Parahaliea mediterranea]